MLREDDRSSVRVGLAVAALGPVVVAFVLV
jgi:hypothetical protein